jgi:hypothetical protein
LFSSSELGQMGQVPDVKASAALRFEFRAWQPGRATLTAAYQNGWTVHIIVLAG